MILFSMLIGLSACSNARENTEPENNSYAEPEIVRASETDIKSTEDEMIEGGEHMALYDFTEFQNVEITGIDMEALDDEELSVLYTQARYCQAMTDADMDAMREIVSENMVFTHMSGMQQSREEYFADIEKGRLNYFTIGIENPVIEVDGDSASVTFTSVLNANAYGARGTFRMKGTHQYKRQDGRWIAVNH